jgi:type I restriction enzyme R subunit
VELDNNPDFYQPLADKLEELINARRENRISQLELFEEFDKIQQKILNKNKEAQDLGFQSEQEFAVFKTLEAKMEGVAEDITKTLFHALSGELSIANWKDKNQVKQEMRVKIKNVLRGKVEPNELNNLSVSLVNLIIRN